MADCTDKQNLYSCSSVTISDYFSEVQPTWCGGCGNYGIWAALKRAVVELGLKPHEILFAFDIGCNGNMNDKITGYRIHGLHGRVLPLAAAAKIANPNVKVIAMAGDGATYSEGMNHFVNSVRNNYPITFIVHDNMNYGLTTGQASATTPQGAIRNSNPDGPTSSTLNPIQLALSLQPSFVARGFSGDITQLTEILKEAILHQERGFGFVDVLQACPTFNRETTHYWYQERVKSVTSVTDYDPMDMKSALKYGIDLDKEILTGVLYKNPDLINFMDRLEYRKNNPEWKDSVIVDEVNHFDISGLVEDFK